MRSENLEQSLKLRLLALVLALVLLWYSVNPAPYTPARRESRDKQPDPQKLPDDLPARVSQPSLKFYGLTGLEASVALPSSDEEPDDFDWPEYIDG